MSGNIIKAAGAASLISVTAMSNTMQNALLSANSADILNSSLTGNPLDGFSLVEVAGDLNVANSIIVTNDSRWTSVAAGTLKSAYSIYSGTPDFTADAENLTEQSFGSVFAGTENGRLLVADGSSAAMGVWTQYDPESRTIIYSVRPENIWTMNYSPKYMQWRYLGGGIAGYNPALLVGSADFPSIGAYWVTGGKNHPDYGPGVSPCSLRDSQESSPTPQFKSTKSLALSFLHHYIKNISDQVLLVSIQFQRKNTQRLYLAISVTGRFL